MWLFFVICLTVLYGISGEHAPTLTIKQGKLMGYYDTSYDGRTFSSFEGIPFAKPPIGDLRFKDPEPLAPWLGTWIANKTHQCSQNSMDPRVPSVVSEDCLYMNVYVPSKTIDAKKNLDVLLHIHGGAFMFGSGDQMGPLYFMDRVVIMVTFNYRLGALGFLSTEDEIVPGNMGMKDQSLALKWVKENIANFGGNPNSITLTGLSAGATSVHMHYLSPLSKGLFNAGLANSGSALAFWGMQQNPLKKAQKLASVVGCTDTTTKTMIECLKQRPASEILKATNSIYTYGFYPLVPFSLVVDKYSDNPFMPKHPYIMLKNGEINDVPLVLSVTTHEGLCPAAFLRSDLSAVDKNWETQLPALLDYEHVVSDNRKPEVARLIKKHYFGESVVNEDNFQKLVTLVGDRMFHLDAEAAARIHSNTAKSDIYFYRFGYRGERSYTIFFNSTEDLGVSHGDDNIYMYKSPMISVDKLTEEDENMKTLMVDMVTEFAKNKKPTINNIEWKPVTSNGKFKLLEINSPSDITPVEIDELGPTAFWKSLNFRANFFVTKDEL